MGSEEFITGVSFNAVLATPFFEQKEQRFVIIKGGLFIILEAFVWVQYESRTKYKLHALLTFVQYYILGPT